VSAALFHRDILDFLALLRKHRVRYLIVGGEAVIQHGYARFTADTDIFYDAVTVNAARLYKALEEFWGGAVVGIGNADELRVTGKVFQFGLPPNRLDLMNSIDGVGFPIAWKGRKTKRFLHRDKPLPVHFIGLEELIRNKRSTRRNKDLDDLRYLLEARRRHMRKYPRPVRPR
jgi:hypothetical protein